MRGGKQEGAGRKPRLKRYKKEKELPKEERRQSTFERRAIEIGQLCETLWREAHADCWKGKKRTSRHKKILSQVAEKFGETESMVDLLWDDYRRLEADLIEDLDGKSPL
jgi:hypothetical protein